MNNSEKEGEAKPGTEKENLIQDFASDLFNLDRGLPATVWAMIKSPGQVIDAYFSDRGRYVNPVRYTIIITAVSTFVITLFIDYGELYRASIEGGAGEDLDVMINNLSEQYPQFDWQAYFDKLVQLMVAVTQKFSQLTYLVLIAPITAVFTYMFFKDKKGRYMHHFVMMIYLMSTVLIFSIFTAPFIDTENLTLEWYHYIGILLQ